MDTPGQDAWDYINNQRRVFSEVTRKLTEEDNAKAPLLVIDDCSTGKVVVVTLRPIPDTVKGRVYSSQRTILAPDKIEPLNEFQYFVLFGDRSDTLYPLHSTEWQGFQPLDAIRTYASRHPERNKNILPPGERLAQVFADCLGDPVATESFHINSLRPRALEAVLISNPPLEKRFPKDRYSSTRIYVIEQSTDVTPLTIVGIQSTAQESGYFCTSQQVWDAFVDHRKSLQGKKRPLTIEENIIAAIAAIANAPGVTRIGHPSEFDITTVPFEKPKDNKLYDRFDPEFLAPLYERAMKLLEK
ncbi:hypothetical protein J4421_04125 [Candidatus Woesearchaeota archaeon]|nr:hypothetical protein [Candidatus Woesearchaeota archaeon]